MSRRTILVTGSQGTLGRHLVARLRANGHEVWGCDLAHQADAQYIRADVRSYPQLQRVFNEHQFDLVYHLAAEFGRFNGEEYYETLWATNAIGTRHILEFQRQHGFELVFTSSSEIYGELNLQLNEHVVDTVAIRPKNDYAITKWVNELQILHMQERYGLPIVRLRLFNAYGPGEHYHPYRSVCCLFCYRALHGIPYTVYRNYERAFQYIDDLIVSMARVADVFIPGRVYNLAGTEIRSVEYLSNIVLQATGADPALVSYLEEDAHNVTSKVPVIVMAQEELGHCPEVTLEDGIQRTIAWMREVYPVGAPQGVSV